MAYRIVGNARTADGRHNLLAHFLPRFKNISFFSQANKTSVTKSPQSSTSVRDASDEKPAVVTPDKDPFTTKAGKENFNVASKILPKAIREHLINVYRYCRYIDDIGDLSDGNRLDNLQRAEAELKESFLGKGNNPIFNDIVRTIQATNGREENLFNLVKANIVDQHKHRYDSFEELCDYCKLSADPVGRLVLSVFGAYTEQCVRYSDKVCTSLQIVEHIQDIAEDYATGRIYLPQEDLQRFHVTEEMLAGKAKTSTSGAKFFDIGYKAKTSLPLDNGVKRLLSFECGRARSLMLEGSPLVSLLPTLFAKIAIAGFIGGGLAQLEAIEKHNYDVIRNEIKASKAKIALCSAKILIKSYFAKSSQAKQLEFRPKSSIARWLR